MLFCCLIEIQSLVGLGGGRIRMRAWKNLNKIGAVGSKDHPIKHAYKGTWEPHLGRVGPQSTGGWHRILRSGCVIEEYVDLIVPTIGIRHRFVFWKDSRAQQQGCQDACCIEMGVYISISFNIPVLHNLVNLEFWLLWFSPLFIYVVFVFRRRKKDEDGCLRVIHNFHITLGQWVYMSKVLISK